jgi:hypothetical protein
MSQLPTGKQIVNKGRPDEYVMDWDLLNAQRKEGAELADSLSARFNIQRRTDYSEQMREPEEMARVRHAIMDMAEKHHSQYPQFKGHWDKWVLGRATSNCTFKGGTEIRKGDYILVAPTATHMECVGGISWYVGVYSLRGTGDCSMLVGDFEIL